MNCYTMVFLLSFKPPHRLQACTENVQKMESFRNIRFKLQDSRKRIHLEVIKKNRKMSICKRLDLEALGCRPIMPKNLPGHC